MSKQRKNYPLRLSNELFDEIKRWADDEMRSVNGQIEFILRSAVNNRRGSKKGKSDRSESADKKSDS